MSLDYRIFVDFDGTITESDVGYELFRKFTNAATEPFVDRYRKGEINALECLSSECEIWNKFAPQVSAIEKHLNSQRLRPGFGEFIDYLATRGQRPIILSEGFDFYIDRVLRCHNLENLDRFTNLAEMNEGKLTPSFPYFDRGCGKCSNCKGYHIMRLRPPDACAIYIGDGHSDLHASRTADIVFARSHLAEAMTAEERPFFHYENFYDIVDHLEEITAEAIFAYNERVRFRFSETSGGLPSAPASIKPAIDLELICGNGRRIGEVSLAFPDRAGLCHHEVCLLPDFRNDDLLMEIWRILLDRAGSRWPESKALVTPFVPDDHIVEIYLKLGFEFTGEAQIEENASGARSMDPNSYRKMVRNHK
jgi:2,3-diketo-5-methylthio-1-phosphopentane phosphatase